METENRLIDLLEEAEGLVNNDQPSLEQIAEYLIEHGVTIPVRCKNCKHRADVLDCGNYLCNRKMIGMVRPNDFCSFGERKKNDA